MKHLERMAPAAGLGLAVLLLAAAFGRADDARPPRAVPAEAQAAVEPAEDPGLDPATTKENGKTQTPESIVGKWSEGARVTARAMIEKYGEPSRYTDDALVWINNGPWQKTVVYRSPWPHFLGKGDQAYLEQTIAYRVPVEKIDDLKRFDRRLGVNESKGQLSSREESEALNFLALNLADEIVTEKRSVEEARDFYLKTEKLSQAGKSSPYLNGLLFSGRVDGKGADERDQTDYDRMMMP